MQELIIETFQNKLLKKLLSEEDPKLSVPSNARVKVSAYKPIAPTPKQNKKTVWDQSCSL